MSRYTVIIKVAPFHAMKADTESGGTAPPILVIDIR